MTDFTTLADRYAAKKAEIDALEAELKMLRDAVLATGQEVIVGERCTVVVGLSDRKTVKWEDGLKNLAPSLIDQIKAGFTAVTSNVPTLRIKAKIA